MRHACKGLLLLTLLTLLLLTPTRLYSQDLIEAADTLDIYFIDVEGGQATLIVTPARESLLVDTGYAGNNGRDAARIMAAVRDAGLDDIDYLLITHFHRDHDGGVVELAQQVPIRAFIDHGGFGPEGRKPLWSLDRSRRIGCLRTPDCG